MELVIFHAPKILFVLPEATEPIARSVEEVVPKLYNPPDVELPLLRKYVVGVLLFTLENQFEIVDPFDQDDVGGGALAVEAVVASVLKSSANSSFAYGVPPATLKLIAPLFSPLQLTSVIVSVNEIAEGSIIVTETELGQPLTSDTV